MVDDQFLIKTIEDTEVMKDHYYNIGYDPRKTLNLYYDEELKRFFEVEEYDGGFLEPINNIHQILEPWKILLFKERGLCVFPDRTKSFLVEIIWILI